MVRPALGLKTKGFVAYLAMQFLGALNDNAYKFLLLSLITAAAAGNVTQENRWSGLAQGLFAVPFVLFAAWAGVLADRYRKSAIFVGAKLVEVALMIGVVLAFAHDSTFWLFALLFLMGLHSTFFGPAKYGYLGETIAEHDLSRANGLVNMTTVSAVVVGQVLGGGLFEGFADSLALGALVMVGIAVAGAVASFFVPRVEAAQPGASLWGSLPELFRTGREVLAHKGLLYTVAGIGHFYLLAALLQVQLFTYAQHVLEAGALGASVFVATSLIGMAVGSLLAARWSERKVELGLVPLGALTMSAFMVALAFVPGGPVAAGGGAWERIVHWGPPFLCVIVLGVGGGLFIVPLNANLQILAPASAKGRFMAFGNMVSFIGIFISAGVWWALGELGLHPRPQALAVGALSLVGTSVSLWMLPESFLRFCGWLLAHSIYRIRVLHPERLPEEGGALLVANHVSWVDWLVLAAITRRRVRFLIYRHYYDWWPVHWLFKLAGCIPVAAGDAPDVVAHSLEEAGRALQEGNLVAIFAEGSVTRTGHLHTIRRGYQRIVQDSGIPIIPVHLDGLWGSVFSHEGGKLLWKRPRAIPYPVTVSVGEPLPPRAEPFEVRAALQSRASEAWEVRKQNRRPLHVTLLREGRRATHAALLEPGRPALSRAAALARALALRDEVSAELGSAPHVGVLLPNGIDGALAVLALLYAGRLPVPLNATLEGAELALVLRRAGIDTVLTSAALAPRVMACGVGRAVDVGERCGRLSRGRVLAWRWACALLPLPLLERLAVAGDRRALDTPVVILFSAGSTGAPKGVVLSHFNVLSNVEAVQEVLDLRERDRLLGVAALSQAIGFTQTLWLPLLTDASVVFVPDALDGRAVGSVAASFRATLMFATPRLLERYLRLVRPEHFGSLRLVFSWGEKLLPMLRTAFDERFGLEPLEAYASTECASLIAMNTPDVRGAGVFQRGARHGTVGHPLPGVSVEIIDPRSGALLPNDAPGLLRIRGPNVMTGYLDDDVLQARELTGDWYLSGDLATLDEDGFITLTGRFKRVSHIDGERVSHGAVEDAICYQLGTADSPVAVCARRTAAPGGLAPAPAGGARATSGVVQPGAGIGPDAEELVVFYRRDTLVPERVVAGLAQAGLPPAWRPRARNFIPVDDIPLLPTGMVDYVLLERAVENGGARST